MLSVRKQNLVIKYVMLALALVFVGMAGYAATRNSSADSLQNVSGEVDDGESARTASWKKYCDESASICFKYPEDWTIETSGEGAIATNNQKTLRVFYAKNYSGDGGTREVMPVSLDDHHKFIEELSVAGTYMKVDDSYRVMYDLFNGNVEDSGYYYGELTAGLDNARFELEGVTYKFSAWPLSGSGNKEFASAADAKNWFESKDSFTLLDIMHSFHRK